MVATGTPPPLDPTAPCPSSTYNATVSLGVTGYDTSLPAFITDAEPGGRNCQYYGSNTCTTFNGIDVWMIEYQNDSGGVSIYTRADIVESSTVYLQGNQATYEGTAVADAGNTTIDCDALDTTVNVSNTGDVGAYGGPLWYTGSSMTVRVEGV